jgi:hypothetical protein
MLIDGDRRAAELLEVSKYRAVRSVEHGLEVEKMLLGGRLQARF